LDKNTNMMKKISGVVFDLDGTLTKPCLNFSVKNKKKTLKNNS